MTTSESVMTTSESALTTSKDPNPSQRAPRVPAGAVDAGARMDGIVKCAAAFLA
jgi:hypothetical protein